MSRFDDWIQKIAMRSFSKSVFVTKFVVIVSVILFIILVWVSGNILINISIPVTQVNSHTLSTPQCYLKDIQIGTHQLLIKGEPDKGVSIEKITYSKKGDLLLMLRQPGIKEYDKNIRLLLEKKKIATLLFTRKK